MLTADLAISWQRGELIRPRHINPDERRWLDAADSLISLFHEHEGRTRGELEQSLGEYVGTGTDYRILRGLIKLLTDRCEFAASAEVEPAELRRALFRAARESHPVRDDEARAILLASVSASLGCTPEQAWAGMYADLPARQRLIAFEGLTGRELLDRYNVAQAQALLYRCVRMKLWLEPQGPEGYRELFGAIKAYRLIHTIKGDAALGYEVSLDGPVSMFHRSQKYGVQMSVFLPALLLCRDWRMRAEIAVRHGGSVFYELTSAQTALRSHYLSVPGYETQVGEKLAESWARRESAWTLAPSREVLDLGGGAFIPDFVLSHPSGRRVYLEILGFWTPEYLNERLEELAHAGREDFLLAAWDELRGSRDPLTRAPARTIIFKRALEPAVVERALEEVCEAECREVAAGPPPVL